MNYIFAFICLFLASLLNANGAERSMLARVTVYWQQGSSAGRACWNGSRLHAGHCAVDPRRIGYGSTVVFPDRACVAVDTGPAVVSRKAARSSGRTASERNAVVVDRFFETKKEALTWARQHPQFMMLQIREADSTKHRAAVSRSIESPFPRSATRRLQHGCMILDEPIS